MASSGTRRGNGAGMGPGWGGPAKGAGKPAPMHAPFTPDDAREIRALYFTAENIADRNLRAEITAEIYNKRLEVLRSGTEAGSLKAGELMDNRLNGAPKTPVEHTGADSGPIKIEDTRRPVTDFITKALAEIDGANSATK